MLVVNTNNASYNYFLGIRIRMLWRFLIVSYTCVFLFLAGEKASPGQRHRGHHICGREESRGRLRVESHLWPQLYEVSLQPHLCSRLVRPHQEWIQVGVHVPGAKSHFMLHAHIVGNIENPNLVILHIIMGGTCKCASNSELLYSRGFLP